MCKLLPTIFAMCLLPACAAVDRRQLDPVAWYSSDCKSIEGTYTDKRDCFAAYHDSGLGRRSLWEFLTGTTEADPLVTSAEKTVSIKNCTDTGFDATLFSHSTAVQHAHIDGRFVDGFFYVAPRSQLVTDNLIITEWWHVAVAVGKSRNDDGIATVALQDGVLFLVGVPVSAALFVESDASFVTSN